MGTRGRPSRGRNKGSGHGRGKGGRVRGRGGKSSASRFDPSNRKFDAVRTAKDDDDDSGVEAGEDGPTGSDAELLDLGSGDESSDPEDDQPAVRPYMALIESLNEGGGREAKRRKLDKADVEMAMAVDQPQEGQEGTDDDSEKDVDAVDEEEEADVEDDEAADADAGDSDSEGGNELDPFEAHFEPPDDSIDGLVKAADAGEWNAERAICHEYRTLWMTPKCEPNEFAGLPAPISGPRDLVLKRRLSEVAARLISIFSPTEQTLASLFFNYRDVLFCERTVGNSSGLRQLACLHALNHVFKTRDRVIKNNAKLSKAPDSDIEARDQGFTRPKVLMITPTRESCARMVDAICRLCEPEQQENRKRFEEAFVDKERKFFTEKPADFRHLFDGNDDDMFRLGVKFTRKTIKYYSPFYTSDIIFASPLGLRMAIGSEEEKKMDCDFLSSIEIVIVDHADALLMQNWEHMEYIFDHLNRQPKESHGCDFSRVRNWYLEGQARFFRQTIVLSAFNTPELSELFRAHCRNWAGKARLQREYSGAIGELDLQARQTFSRFESRTIEGDPDARFEYFTTAIVPMLVKRSKEPSRTGGGTLIFIPSYLDFVRVRNYFANSPAAASLTFGVIADYTEVPEASRARSHFVNRRHHVLLYTERAHHFRRYAIRGVQRVIMYGLPDNPIFYREIVGSFLALAERDSLLEPGQGTVRVMFSKYDVLKLERIVGSQRVGKMIRERGDTFEFV